jgi:hypothetical protein
LLGGVAVCNARLQQRRQQQQFTARSKMGDHCPPANMLDIIIVN